MKPPRPKPAARPAAAARVPAAFLRACRAHEVELTPFTLIIQVASQTVALFERTPTGGTAGRATFKLRNIFRCSTSRFGLGQVADTNRTPLGLHRIAEKIGDGEPAGTVFRNRRAVGQAGPGDAAAITTRILWLDGLEPGFNRSGKVDTHARYIYIHGTGDETTLGRPASRGCIHLAAADLIPLYELLPAGTLVWITAGGRAK